MAYYSKTAESKKSKSSQEESIHYLQMNNNISNDLGNLDDDIMTYLKNYLKTWNENLYHRILYPIKSYKTKVNIKNIFKIK